LHERHKEIQSSENYTALGMLSLVEKRTVSVLPVIEKGEKIKKQKEPGKFSSQINNFVQGVLNLVDDDNEDVPLK